MNTNTRVGPYVAHDRANSLILVLAFLSTRADPQRQTKLVMLLLSVQSTLYETRHYSRTISACSGDENDVTGRAATAQHTERRERERDKESTV